jgi:hypothetical protein
LRRGVPPAEFDQVPQKELGVNNLGKFGKQQKECIERIVRDELKKWAELELVSVGPHPGEPPPRWEIFIRDTGTKKHILILCRDDNDYCGPSYDAQLRQQVRRELATF